MCIRYSQSYLPTEQSKAVQPLLHAHKLGGTHWPFWQGGSHVMFSEGDKYSLINSSAETGVIWYAMVKCHIHTKFWCINIEVETWYKNVGYPNCTGCRAITYLVAVYLCVQLQALLVGCCCILCTAVQQNLLLSCSPQTFVWVLSSRSYPQTGWFQMGTLLSCSQELSGWSCLHSCSVILFGRSSSRSSIPYGLSSPKWGGLHTSLVCTVFLAQLQWLPLFQCCLLSCLPSITT